MDPLFLLQSQPGVRRDGTDLDSPFYNDSVWVRWQRGKPRKMGGYKSMTQLVNGPVRSVFQDSRSGVNSTHLFSQWGVQRVQFSYDGNSSSIEDRTPAGFAVNTLLNWSHSSMYSAVGGTYSAIIAASSPDLLDIANDTPGYVYAGDIASNDPLVQVSDGSGAITTSGGVCVLNPFLVVYGSNGLIRNSNANDYSTGSGWTTGGANLASSNNVSGTKIVYGAPLRGGGQSPAGLFWSLESLVRMSFVGGTGIWQYDTLTLPTTVLSKKAIVEHEGKFFWPATDRFLFYNGVVQELPNQMNCNWFFDNLNYACQNKVWGTKIARWGEIWWFYPRGSDTECKDAIIFNYRENTWYDAHIERTAGAPTGIFAFPIWAGPEDSVTTKELITGIRLVTSAATSSSSKVLTFTATTGIVDGMVASGAGIVYGSLVVSHDATTITLDTNTTGVLISTTLSFTSMTTAFRIGDTITGGTSAATGIAKRVLNNSVNVSITAGAFVSGETITSGAATAVLQASSITQQLVTQYQHEFGKDKIVGSDVSSIVASFTTANFGFAIGDPFADVPKTIDVLTRIVRIEPDFKQVGPLTLEVLGRSFAKDATSVKNSYQLNPADSFQNMGDQARIMQLRVTSDSLAGDFEMGQVYVKIEPGDERSTA